MQTMWASVNGFIVVSYRRFRNGFNHFRHVLSHSSYILARYMMFILDVVALKKMLKVNAMNQLVKGLVTSELHALKIKVG